MPQNSDSTNADRDSANGEQTVWETVTTALGFLITAGVAIGSVVITARALVTGRPLSWWFRTDACPGTAVTCGQPPWAGIAVAQAIAVVLLAVWLFDTFSGDTFPRGGG